MRDPLDLYRLSEDVWEALDDRYRVVRSTNSATFHVACRNRNGLFNAVGTTTTLEAAKFLVRGHYAMDPWPYRRFPLDDQTVRLLSDQALAELLVANAIPRLEVAMREAAARLDRLGVAETADHLLMLRNRAVT